MHIRGTKTEMEVEILAANLTKKKKTKCMSTNA
jgi:hypothetical protein